MLDPSIYLDTNQLRNELPRSRIEKSAINNIAYRTFSITTVEPTASWYFSDLRVRRDIFRSRPWYVNAIRLLTPSCPLPMHHQRSMYIVPSFSVADSTPPCFQISDKQQDYYNFLIHIVCLVPLGRLLYYERIPAFDSIRTNIVPITAQWDVGIARIKWCLIDLWIICSSAIMLEPINISGMEAI